ncbi:hypothetical protein G9464_18100 [Halostella sp. JP-L12]|uniref:SIR2 family NAD-dependent protein deacylase n=1 Tax=Halostella TaxID=1843185 RepID=UPI000EF7E32E|nr:MULTISPECIES: Sir2 family NAD-dependent protein deacetylase [Halostella]NHN49486.1 hypothetical protein [Halostella sp. JP-L12]
MSDPRLRKGARLVRDADEVVLHVGPELLAGTDVPADELAASLWGDPDGSFTMARFEEHPERVWDDWLDFWDDAAAGPASADPRPVHERVAELVADGHVSSVLTENVFGQLRAAGVPEEDSIEFHGRADLARCEYCERTFDVAPERTTGHRRCHACGGTLGPGVVLAGEPPARHDRLAAYARAEKCDVYVAAGTRLSVDPTAENAEHAVESGAGLLVIGERPTPMDGAADYRIREDPASALARLRDAVAILQ